MNSIIRKIGNSEGAIMPEVVKADSNVTVQRFARQFMDRYRDALAKLAQ